LNSIESVWKKLLKKCMEKGVWHTKDDGDEILEIMNNHCFIPNVMEKLYCGGSGISTSMFVDMIGQGIFNIDGYPIKDTALQSYVKELDDDSHIYLEGEDSFVYTYPERLLNVCQVNRFGEVVNENQIKVMIDRLLDFDGSNRAVANLYMCGFDKEEQHIPCLNFVQALIRDNELSLHIMFRSNDLFSAFPSNMLFIQYLGFKINDRLKQKYPLLKFRGVYYNSTSLHIYKGDYEQVKKLLG